MSVEAPALAMPYPGLRPFEAEDQPLFFGREAQVGGMLRQLEDHRFVAVVGSSGSGKSSLVRAGLLPAIREGFLFDTTDWLTLVIKPGHEPYQRLARSLFLATCRTESSPLAPSNLDPIAPQEAATFATLRRTDGGLLTALDQLGISPEGRVIVVVDQFEELFAFRRAGVNRDNVASRDEAAAFVGMLLRSAADPAGRIWVVLTMRSDFIGDCEAFLGLPEQISRSQFLVPRLDRVQMEEAITRPAAVHGAAFAPFTFEDGLVNRIINDAGDRPDQLPLMQHALMRTWKHAAARAGAGGPMKVMPADYEAAGGIENALSLHADAAWDEIKADPKMAGIARRLFLLLCDISPDGQITRRRPRMDEIRAVTGASVAEIEKVVRVFQQDDRNFLLPPPPQPLTAESYLDISHEALLRQWRRFAVEWQEQERRDASELRRLAELASLRKQGQGVGLLPAQDLDRIARWRQRVSADWARRYVTAEGWDEALRFVEESQKEAMQQREEDERQRRAEQRKKLVYVVTGILLVATLFSVWQMVAAWRAREGANKARASAENATNQAQAALSRPFLRTIGSSFGAIPTLDERESLWDLATLAPANAKVRTNVIDDWFKDEEASMRALRRDGQGWHAAVGLDEERRKHAASKAKDFADLLAAKLEKETDIDRLAKTGATLAELTARMEPKDAADAAKRGAQILAPLLANPQKTDPDRMSKLGSALAGLAAWMKPVIPKDAENFAGGGAQVLATTLENPEVISPDSLKSLGTALEALAAQVAPEDAGRLATRLAQALENPPETSAARLAALGIALEAFAVRLKPEDAAKLGTKGAQALTKALLDPQATDADRLWPLGKALAPLAARMDSATAATTADKLAKDLENLAVVDLGRVWSLGSVLAPMATRINPSDAGRIGIRLAKALAKPQETSAGRLWSFGTALAALAGQMDSADAAIVIDILAPALEKPQETSTDRLWSLSYSLAAAVRRAEPDAAARGVKALTRALESLAANDADRLASLASALESVSARMDSATAATAAEALATALENQKVIDANRTWGLAGALAALAVRMDPKDAAKLGARGLQTVAKALADPQITDSASVARLGWALGRLSPLVPSAKQSRLAALSHILLIQVPGPSKTGEAEPAERKQLSDLYMLLEAREFAEVLKWPFCVGETQKLALAALEKKTGSKFDGDLWKFVAQASRLGIQDLDQPAKRPFINEATEELGKPNPVKPN